MLGSCSNCNDNVGYFKLQDTICNTCISNKKPPIKSKISRIFSFSPFLGLIFIMGFIAHFIMIGINPIERQIVLSSLLMVLALVFFFASFIVRFYLCRRKIHIALALAFSFPFVAIFSTIIGVVGTSPGLISILGFIFFPFYILRLPNISLIPNEDNQQK